jgi:hypothetical protein
MLTELNPAVDSRWDKFVLGHPEGTIYHHSAWQQVLSWLQSLVAGGNRVLQHFVKSTKGEMKFSSPLSIFLRG